MLLCINSLYLLHILYSCVMAIYVKKPNMYHVLDIKIILFNGRQFILQR